PTGGYLIGFVFAALFLGRAVKYDRNNPVYLFAVFSICSFAILGFGTLWLKVLLGLTFKRALFLGFVPFVAGDLFKALAASYLYFKFQSRIKEVL
ncbi:MAG: biotin transporter BioY, partial [Candidatus Omnitrophica bacterium]|nr:biotin transporter BioY [Candidatus Omnitrophota bacterium]